MPIDSDIGEVDASMEIVKYASGNIPPDSGIPSGDFMYSDYNSIGSTLYNGGKVMSTVSVGSGGNIINILSNNGTILNGVKDALNNVNVTLGTNGIKVNGVDKVETEIKNLKDGFVDNIIKQTQEMAKGNALKVASNILKQTANQSQQEANTKQNQKNDKLIENLDFQKDGKSGFVDTDGNRIKPREAKAKKDIEKAIEETRMNKLDTSKILSGLSVESDSLADVGKNLITECLQFYVDVDVEQLDSILKNDVEFNNV